MFAMTIDRYLERRRTWETLIVLGLLSLGFLASLGVEWIEFLRDGAPVPPWQPLVLEATSHLAVLAVFPLVLWFDRLVPIRLSNLGSSVPAHIAFSVVFSLAHVGLMYRARVASFSLIENGRYPYHWDNWFGQFVYEYLKDFRTYLVIVALLYLYRFILRRAQGEAGFVDDSDDAGQAGVSDRFLVKKLGREFLVRMNDIDWIESCGNYVNLHVGGKVYPLRDTMTNISERLESHGFQRVHRSAIVNLDRVAEIVAYDTGDGAALLRGDISVPVSRRFRKDLRERLG